MAGILLSGEIVYRKNRSTVFKIFCQISMFQRRKQPSHSKHLQVNEMLHKFSNALLKCLLYAFTLFSL